MAFAAGLQPDHREAEGIEVDLDKPQRKTPQVARDWSLPVENACQPGPLENIPFSWLNSK